MLKFITYRIYHSVYCAWWNQDSCECNSCYWTNDRHMDTFR